MDTNQEKRKTGIELDVQRLIGRLWRKLWLIVAVAVACAMLSALFTSIFVTPLYQSSAMFYVNNGSFSVGDAGITIDSGDISASKSLVDSYIVILQTKLTLYDVIDYAGVDRTAAELRDMISAASVNSTEIFEVVVTSPDPYEAQKIADAISYILPKRIDGIIEGTAKIVDVAEVPTSPSSPSYALNGLVGFVVGLIVCVAALILWEIFDVTIREESDITQNCSYPILASVPDMTAAAKGGYYGYGSRKAEQQNQNGKQPGLIGGSISFAAAESYKLLRTKLQYSFADSGKCRVIGISSTMAGEGKSLSAVNLAYSLSQLGKRVLLMDCDLRRPSVYAKLRLKRKPGLSDYLSGQNSPEEIFRRCGLPGEEDAFRVIPAGNEPPNPVELLSSDRMTALMEQLRDGYDYILLDLPPAGEVSDALAMAEQTDGMLLVVRQNYCNRVGFSSVVRQFEFVGAKVLGLVCNCAAENENIYARKYYQRSYRPKYGGEVKKHKKLLKLTKD